MGLLSTDTGNRAQGNRRLNTWKLSNTKRESHVYSKLMYFIYSKAFEIENLFLSINFFITIK